MRQFQGNRLLHDFVGTSALARFERDVLSEPGVKWVTLLEGINDIGFSNLPNAAAGEAVTADDVMGLCGRLWSGRTRTGSRSWEER